MTLMWPKRQRFPKTSNKQGADDGNDLDKMDVTKNDL